LAIAYEQQLVLFIMTDFALDLVWERRGERRGERREGLAVSLFEVSEVIERRELN
jgi:hypothetical protein